MQKLQREKVRIAYWTGMGDKLPTRINYEHSSSKSYTSDQSQR